MSDYLVCTQCGKETDVRVDEAYKAMGTTKAGTPRKFNRWRKNMAIFVAHWMCSDCLTIGEEALENDK